MPVIHVPTFVPTNEFPQKTKSDAPTIALVLPVKNNYWNSFLVMNERTGLASIWPTIISVVLATGLVSMAEPVKDKSNEVMPGSYMNKFGRVIPGFYNIDTNGKYYLATNIEAMWPGVWRENTNGWRTQLYCWNQKGQDAWASIGIGNTTTNVGRGYFWTLNETFSKCELEDSDGTVILSKAGIKLEDQCSLLLSVREFPKWPDGKLKNRIGFFTNSPPWVLKQFRFRDVYHIEKEGDYTLTVCVAIYKVGTNSDNLAHRIDLPCVTAKVHLKPDLKEQ